MAYRGHEIQLLNEGFEGLPQDDQDLTGRPGNFRGATRSRQSHRGPVVWSDNSSINVSKAIDLSSTQETDINAPSLQPESKDLAGRYRCISRTESSPSPIDR